MPPQGSVGVTGAIGASGVTGAIGAAGQIGASGLVGPPGAAGPIGPTGLAGAASTAAGPTGAAGSAGTNAVRYFAAVTGVGVLSLVRVHGVAAASRTSAGIYDVTLTATPDASMCVGVAQLSDGPGYARATPDGTGHVAVTTWSIDGSTLANHDFVVTVSC
jgi:hypothetical protein